MTLTVRITRSAKDQLHELAEADDRSMARYLERLIASAYQAYKKGSP